MEKDNEALRRLPDSELTVMQAVWDCPVPCQRSQIEAALPADRPMALTTLLTLLTRLAEKDFLRIEKQGRGSVYYSLVSKRQYLAAQSRRFVDKLCGGSLSVFAAALCDSGLSREDLEELQELLKKKEL